MGVESTPCLCGRMDQRQDVVSSPPPLTGGDETTSCRSNYRVSTSGYAHYPCWVPTSLPSGGNRLGLPIDFGYTREQAYSENYILQIFFQSW